MKYFIKLLVLLITVLQINSVMAAENIAGTWQGKLITSPGSEMTLQFIIKQEANGSYSVTLNSPDEGGIKNVKASSMVFNSGNLKMDVTELSGSYEGIFKDGKIDGKWKQEGKTFPLSLIPYEKPTLSKKDMEKLLGAWNGILTIPGGSLTVVFRFEMTKEGELAGFLDSPDQGGYGIPVNDIEMSESSLSLKISSIKAQYKGKVVGNEIVGDFTQLGSPNPLSLKKGEYKAQGYNLNLSKENMEKLLGKWNGKLGPLTLVFRFEKTKEGSFVGYLDSPDQGAKGIPITEASLTDGKLNLKVKSVSGEFNGQLSGDKLAGEWTQMGMKNPLSLTKEKP